MEKLKGVHVSFDIVTEFVPRVPRQRCPGENSSIPRICIADNLYNAINAIPQAGLVLNYMKSLELPLVIHAYYLKGNGMKNEDVQKYVPDANLTGELWLTEKPEKVYRIDYEIVDFTTKDVKDPFSHDLTVVYGIKIKRCRFQNNIENFLHSFGNISQSRRTRVEKIFEENSFRTVISNIGDVIKKK